MKAIAQKIGLALFWLTFAVVVCFTAGCGEIVTQTDLNLLPTANAQELLVYSEQHPNVWFDIRAPIHNLQTCPYLSLTPALIWYADHPLRRAWFLRYYFEAKHKQEDHCRCVEILRECTPEGCPITRDANGIRVKEN